MGQFFAALAPGRGQDPGPLGGAAHPHAVGEGLPLALDARAARVEGLAEAVMAKPDWFAGFFTSVVISSTRLQLRLFARTAPLRYLAMTLGIKHSRRFTYSIYDPRVLSGEVSHLLFHELPGSTD